MTAELQGVRIPVGEALPLFPNWASTAFYWLHKGCFLRRVWIRMTERVENPTLALGGVLLANLYGDAAHVQVAAKVLLIARVLLDALNDGAEVAKTWQEFWHPLANDLSSGEKYRLLRISVRTFAREEGQIMEEVFLPNPLARACSRIRLIASRFFKWVKAVGRLGARLFELADAVVMTRYAQIQAVADSPLELRAILRQVDRQQKLRSALEMYRPLMDRLFSSLNGNWTAQGFLDSVEQLSGPAERVQRVGGAVVGGAQTAIHGTLKVLAGAVGLQS